MRLLSAYPYMSYLLFILIMAVLACLYLTILSPPRPRPKRHPAVFLQIAENPKAPYEGRNMKRITLAPGQFSRLHLIPRSAPPISAVSTVEPGSVYWTISDPDVASLLVAADGLSAVATPNLKVGVAQVIVTADANLGSEVSTIAGQIEVEVVPGPAAVLDIEADEPAPIPVPTPAS